MYQNYNSAFNPLEKHFQTHEDIIKKNNTLAHIVTFALGAITGILVYRWIESAQDKENNFEFQENTE